MPMTIKKTPEVLGRRVTIEELEIGTEILVCPTKPDARQRFHNSCEYGTFMGAEYREGWYPKVVIFVQFEQYGVTSYQELEFPVIRNKVNGEEHIDYSTNEIFLRNFGSTIATVAHAKNLSPDTANTIAEMLTGRRPQRDLPARVSKKQIQSLEEKNEPQDTSQMYKALGGKTRKAKGRKNRKRAGQLSTRRHRSS
jgi:hypothetical protein